MRPTNSCKIAIYQVNLHRLNHPKLLALNKKGQICKNLFVDPQIFPTPTWKESNRPAGSPGNWSHTLIIVMPFFDCWCCNISYIYIYISRSFIQWIWSDIKKNKSFHPQLLENFSVGCWKNFLEKSNISGVGNVGGVVGWLVVAAPKRKSQGLAHCPPSERRAAQHRFESG